MRSTTLSGEYRVENHDRTLQLVGHPRRSLDLAGGNHVQQAAEPVSEFGDFATAERTCGHGSMVTHGRTGNGGGSRRSRQAGGGCAPVATENDVDEDAI
jgi:hypothetical protein